MIFGISRTKQTVRKQGLSQAAPLRQSRAAIGIVPLKNGQGDNLSPSKFREKHERSTHEEFYYSTEIAS